MAFGGPEIWLIVLVVVVLFGAAAIPKLARSLGRAQGEFQKARGEFESELNAGRREGHAPPSADEQERRIRAAARDLGIEEEGKPLSEVKRLLNEKTA